MGDIGSDINCDVTYHPVTGSMIVIPRREDGATQFCQACGEDFERMFDPMNDECGVRVGSQGAMVAVHAGCQRGGRRTQQKDKGVIIRPDQREAGESLLAWAKHEGLQRVLDFRDKYLRKRGRR